MDWPQIITIILGSSVLSTVLNNWYVWWSEKKRNEKVQEESLYSQLRFYLKLFNAVGLLKDELITDNRKLHEENTQSVHDTRLKSQLLMNNLEDSREFKTKLIKDRWIYIEKIKNLLEDNSKYIKNKDWDIVERFFKEYFRRELVVGKDIYKDGVHTFTSGQVEKAFDGILNIMNEMFERFK